MRQVHEYVLVTRREASVTFVEQVLNFGPTFAYLSEVAASALFRPQTAPVATTSGAV